MRIIPLLIATAVATASATAVATATPALAADANLALNKPATGSTSCNANEGPAKAVNGTVTGGNTDKFCSNAASKFLQVDLGSAQSVTSFTVKHAGAGGEATTYNTKAFSIALSTDGSTWSTPVTVSGNTASTTTHPITTTSARYAKLTITTPTQTTDTATRIYEFEVFGGTTTPTTNLALNRPASGSAPCATAEGPAKAVNGSVSGGNTDKFCSLAATKYLQVDLGSAASVTGFTVKHAGAGGEPANLNTKAFTIALSSDGSTWTTPVTVTANTAGTTTHPITATSARHAKLTITTPTQTTDSAARIYEFEVHGTAGQAPSVIPIFDQIPQFGIYVSTEPNYTPPAGVLMWNRGTEYAKKLTAAEQGQLGRDVALRLTYHAQCDNYDRFGSLFYLSMPKGQVPTAVTQRVTLQDFITPFSNYWRGDKATLVYPDAPMAAYANALADTSRDVYVGISGGSNPYAQDACSTRPVDAAFKAVGFRYSLSLVSSQPLTAGDPDVTGALSRHEIRTNTHTTSAMAHTAQTGKGTLAVSIAGYGAASGGEEYSSTTVTLTALGREVGRFHTGVDCATYEQYSPDGNPGIFRNNLTTNPRSWCPGRLVETRFFDLGDISGQSVAVTIGIGRSAPFVGDSNYRTSVSLIER